MQKIKQTGKSVALVALLGSAVGGCADTTVPLSFSSATNTTSSTQEAPTASVSGASGDTGTPSGSSGETTAPIVTNISLNPGDCPILAAGQTYILGGDVLINGQQPYDNQGDTGTEYLITGNQPTPICAEFGAEEHIIPNNPNVIASEENDVYQGLRRSGCINNTGCSGGVQFVTVENGNIVNVVMHNGTNFDN